MEKKMNTSETHFAIRERGCIVEKDEFQTIWEFLNSKKFH